MLKEIITTKPAKYIGAAIGVLVVAIMIANFFSKKQEPAAVIINLSQPSESLFAISSLSDTMILVEEGRARAMLSLGYELTAYIPANGFDYEVDDSAKTVFIHLPETEFKVNFELTRTKAIDLKKIFKVGRVSTLADPIARASLEAIKIKPIIERRARRSRLSRKVDLLARDHYSTICEALGYKTTFK